MLKTLALIGASLTLACTAPTLAQPENAPAPAAPELPWDASTSPRDAWTLTDGDLARVMDGLLGSYRSGGTNDTPALELHIAPISIEGLSNAAYFELHRADDAPNPFRGGILHAYRRQGEPRIRTFELNADAPAALKGLWAVPYAFPALELSELSPASDLVIRMAGTGFEATTPIGYPTMRDGATEFTSKIAMRGNSLTLSDRGFDADGTQVWGDASDLSFTRFEPAVNVSSNEGGLIMIDLNAPDDAEILESGGEVAVHYAGYLTDGTRFDTSRQAGRDAFRTTIPGRVIQGWNQGVLGMKVGQRRRLVIPSALGYGDRGAGGLIPPGATLLFDVECLWVKNPEPAPEGDADVSADQGG